MKKNTKNIVLHLIFKNWQSEVLDAKVPVLVDFTAPWCEPCKALAPLVVQVAQERKGTVKVGKLNIDRNKRITDKYCVLGVPTLLVFINGEVVGRAVGSMPKKDIDNLLDRAIKGQRPGMLKKGK